MTATTDPRTAIDLTALAHTPGFVTDPYPAYRALRQQGRTIPDASGLWLVPRYADVFAGLRDPRLSCDFGLAPQTAQFFGARGISAELPPPLNALDGVDHQRIRASLVPPFAARAVHALAPVVRAAVTAVLDRLAARAAAGAPVDLVAELAYPVPVAVIAELFGIPPTDHGLLTRWSEAFGAVSDPDPLLTDEQRDAVAAATAEAGAYFGRMLVDRHRRPGSDLLSQWLATARAQRTMNIRELLVNGVFLLMVGHHNTVSLISSGLLALLERPDQLAILRAAGDADLDRAMDELIRFDSPVQTATRFTTEPLLIGDVTVPTGSAVLLLLGSANRDERTFTDPDRVDLTRANAGTHVGLGRGVHACVGGPLARLEAGWALRAVARRFPHLEPAGTPGRRVPSFSLRGVSALPTVLGRPAA